MITGKDKGQRGKGLQNADDHGLLAGLFELAEAELIADGKGDKAHRHIGEGAERGDALIIRKDDAMSGRERQKRVAFSGEKTIINYQCATSVVHSA